MSVSLQPTYLVQRAVYIKPKKTYVYSEREAIEHCFDIVCEVLNFTKSEILIKSRKRERVLARQIVSCLIYQFTKLTLKDIAKELHLRNHTTICHARETISNLLDYDKIIQHQYQRCKVYIASMHKPIIKDNQIHYKNL